MELIHDAERVIRINITLKIFPKSTSMLFAIIPLIIYLFILGVGIYLIFLLIKALRIYIKKNF